jgi:membrane protease YdiL (CAAX protease family)
MSDTDPRRPLPFSLDDQGQPFPGPFAAIFITMAAFTAALFCVLLLADQPMIMAAGVGEAIGLGGVATLAARRVPEPQSERLGMRGFQLRLLLPLLMLLPVVVLISEVDNWVRPLFPVAEEVAEALAADAPGPLSESTQRYETIQTAIVAIGIQPVVNAFLFFGVLLQGLVAHVGRTRGIAVTTFLYLVVHAPISDSPGGVMVLLLNVLVTCAFFCIARLGTGSILAPMLLSAGFGVIHLAALRGAGWMLPIPGFNADGDHTPLVILLPCLACVGYGLLILSRAMLAAPPPPPIPPQIELESDEGFHF